MNDRSWMLLSFRSVIRIICLMLAVVLAGTAGARPAINVDDLRKTQAEAEQQYQLQRYGPQFVEYVNRAGMQNFVDQVYGGFQLVGVAEDGTPIFYKIRNANSARTVRTDKLYPNAGYGYSLTGAFTNYMSLWDAGTARTTHQEFNDFLGIPRVFNQDGTPMHFHTQHVAGTMVAGGVNTQAKGMSYQAYLNVYDWNNDTSEMVQEAMGATRITNHSYGQPMGWEWNDETNPHWWWYGGTNDTWERQFGRYYQISRQWDGIAHDNPYLIICVSAGNDRGDTGPGAGGQHYVANTGQLSNLTRERDGGDTGYDCMGYRGVGKNIFSIGAVNDVTTYYGPESVSISDFSSYGPSDDGRIKPDVVANGVNLTSTGVNSNSDYLTISGTSMSSPSAAGTLGLLEGLYHSLFAQDPLSTTLRGVVIHTADECGSWDGPDYRFGWGLINALAAADQMTWADSNPVAIQERELTSGSSYTQALTPIPGQPLRATLIWNDEEGTYTNGSNDPTPVLVNDLDLRLTDAVTRTTYFPYVLGGLNNPTMPATTGDNTLDICEMIYVEDVPPGDYNLVVTHKGTLTEIVSYSLIISGALDADDPRLPIENLSGNMNYGAGTANLSWDFNGGPTFQHFKVMRDGTMVGTTTQESFSDPVPSFGTYAYEVVAVYDEGESQLNPTVDVWFPSPVNAGFFGYSVVNEPALLINLTWEQSRPVEIAYDDGIGETFLSFSQLVQVGIIAAQKFTLPAYASLKSISAYIDNDVPFGQFKFHVMQYTGDDVIPGNDLWSSGPLEATAEGWFDYDLPERLMFNGGQSVWLAFEWLENGATALRFDSSADEQHNRGVIYANLTGQGWEWYPLNEFIAPGTYSGDLLMRGTFGDIEHVGELGLTGFNIYRDGVEIGSTTDLSYPETIPGNGVYEYMIESVYQQGSEFSAALVVDTNALGVPESDPAPERPTEFTIEKAYPNPFNPSLTIPVALATTASVTITAYDILGRQVASVNEGRLAAGQHQITWSADGLASGVYFLRITAGPAISTQKVVLMR